MFIPDPDFYPSRIPELTITIKRRENKFVVLPLAIKAKNFITKLFHFRRGKKKVEPTDKELTLVLFTQTTVTKLS
jgi:hypothetical protein